MKRKMSLSAADEFVGLWVIVHLGFGWGYSSYNTVEPIYLLPGSVMTVAAFICSILHSNGRVKAACYIKYLLVLSMISVTFFVLFAFEDGVIMYLHSGFVLTISAIYLLPHLILLCASIYAISFYILCLAKVSAMDDIAYYITVPFGLALMSIFLTMCYVSRNKGNELRQQERTHNFERMGQQEHLAAVGQIAASIAHDIRNPLTTIQGFIQMIERSERREGHKQYFKIIRSEITRIDRLITEVLMLSKSHTIDGSQSGHVQMEPLLKRLTMLMEPDAIQSGIQIHFETIKDGIITGSEEKLHQVFLNIFRNAFEAIGSNGTIRIVLASEQETAVVKISNDGPQIPEHIIDNMFTPFFTTKENGTGLGLPICQSIVKAHGGSISVRNLPSGVEFTVTIPLVQKVENGGQKWSE